MVPSVLKRVCARALKSRNLPIPLCLSFLEMVRVPGILMYGPGRECVSYSVHCFLLTLLICSSSLGIFSINLHPHASIANTCGPITAYAT